MDALEVVPLDEPLDATVAVPGSRSITNRALVCAALADGTSTLTGVLDSDDTQAMLGCLSSLGIEWRDLGAHTLAVDGCGGALPPGPARLHTRLSGTTSRFVTALCALGHGDYVVDADEPMRSRPMGDLVTALRHLGVEIDAEDGHLPITVHADGLTGGAVELPGDVSSQFTSALMLIGPATPDGIQVTVSGDQKSKPYVQMTTAVQVSFDDARRRGIPFPIEPDASTACYFWGAAAACAGRVTVSGFDHGSMQGDVGFLDVLARMGCEVEGGTVRGSLHLDAVDADLSDISDQAPTFGVVAAFAEGTSRASGIGFIRRKESDRIAAVVEGLRELGVEAYEEPDGFRVVGCGASGPPHGGRISTHDDHRIAMSFAIAGLRTPGVVIEDPGCVAKTFPGFFHELDRLRAAA